MLAAAIENSSFSLGASERSAPAQAPAAAPATIHAEPAWESNPFTYPLLQVPSK